MSTHSIEKLPKWAQERILAAEYRIKSLEQDRDALHDPENDKISMGYGDAGEPRLWLPDDHVTMHLVDKRDWIQFQRDVRGRCIKVMASGQLSVHPQASNTVELRVL